MKLSKKIAVGLSAAALAAAGITTSAVASIPDSDDSEFHACVANTGPVRAVYMIDKESSESCAAGYTEKVWPGSAPAQPHVKVVKKTKLSGGSGGDFGDYYSCGSGWIATGVTWKVTPSAPQSTSDVIVYPVNVRVNHNESSPSEVAAFFNSRSVGSTSGQVSVEVRITCISNVVNDGVTTS